MTALIITRGYPASGKTTWARQWVNEGRGKRGWSSRDALRKDMFDEDGVLSYEQEQLITTVQRAQVEAMIRAGLDVVVHDTNLRLRYARAWADLAAALGAEFSVQDFPTAVEDCVRRDQFRDAESPRVVGEDVIRSMAAKFPIGRWPEVKSSTTVVEDAPRQYTGTPGGRRAWIVDIDGTLADHNGRDPYDTSRYHEDLPFPVIVQLVKTLAEDSHIVITSGRDAAFREVTEGWLWSHHIHFDNLIMRPAGDRRKDHVVKAELFWERIAPHYDVQGCIDDRDRVVAMWRSLGLTCLQVAPGDF